MSVEKKKSLPPAWLERKAGQVAGEFLCNGTHSRILYLGLFYHFRGDWFGKGIWRVGRVVVGWFELRHLDSERGKPLHPSYTMHKVPRPNESPRKIWGCIRKEELLLSVDCG